jgi:hypothetical protein
MGFSKNRLNQQSGIHALMENRIASKSVRNARSRNGFKSMVKVNVIGALCA